MSHDRASTGTASNASDDPPDPPRRDPKTLLEICPPIFKGLSRAEIDAWVRYYSLPRALDPFDKVEECLTQTGPPEPVEEILYPHLLRMYQRLLRKVCERAGSTAIADLADDLWSILEDAAHQGTTSGEQRMSLQLRYPHAYSQMRTLGVSDVPSAKSARTIADPLRPLRAVHEHDLIFDDVKRTVPSHKSKRAADKKGLFSSLLDRYPEEAPSFLNEPWDMIDLSPAKIAIRIWAHRESLSISEGTAENKLAEYRRQKRDLEG